MLASSTSTAAPIILSLQAVLCHLTRRVFQDHRQTRQDQALLDCNPFHIPNATKPCHCRAVTHILLFAQQISPFAWLRLRQWPLCKVSLSDFCCLCESKSAYSNSTASLAGLSPLLPPVLSEVSMSLLISIAWQRGRLVYLGSPK